MMTREEFGNISNGMRRELVALASRFLKATGGPEEAEDIVQEALLTLWELYDKGDPTDANGIPLGVIRSNESFTVAQLAEGGVFTKNICVSRYRKRKLETCSLKDDSVVGGPPADDRVEAADNTRIKKAVYGELTKSEAELMVLKTEDNLTLDEIAKETGRPKPSIKVTLSNARKKLREQLKKI